MPTVNQIVETEVEVEVEVYCQTCGDGLCDVTDVVETRTRKATSFRVQACSKCIEAAIDEGYDKGYEAARKEFGV